MGGAWAVLLQGVDTTAAPSHPRVIAAAPSPVSACHAIPTRRRPGYTVGSTSLNSKDPIHRYAPTWPPIRPRRLSSRANLHCQNRVAAEPQTRTSGCPRAASNSPCSMPQSRQWGWEFSLINPSQRPDSASAPQRGKPHHAVARRLRDIAIGVYAALMRVRATNAATACAEAVLHDEPVGRAWVVLWERCISALALQCCCWHTRECLQSQC